MADNTQHVTLRYIPGSDDPLDGEFVYTGSAVKYLNIEDSHYPTILLPPGDAGAETVLSVELQWEGKLPASFGTAPVQWLEFDPKHPEVLMPSPPPRDEIVSVQRLSDTLVRIQQVNPGRISTYRFLLVVFYGGHLLVADPTMINPPDQGGPVPQIPSALQETP